MAGLMGRWASPGEGCQLYLPSEGGNFLPNCYICFILLWQERIWNNAYSLGPHLLKETSKGWKAFRTQKEAKYCSTEARSTLVTLHYVEPFR